MEKKADCRLYLITPPAFELKEFLPRLKEALEGGDVASLQLRLKEASDDQILQTAEAILPLCEEKEIAFILNDRPDLARRAGAHGLHLGADDMDIAMARAIVGEEIVIGSSCYASEARAFEAGEKGADYVAFGAFYPTTTKEPRGYPKPEILSWWSAIAVLPCVAIGGITPANLAPLVQAGADFLAVVTGVWNHPKGPGKAVEAYNEAIMRAKQ